MATVSLSRQSLRPAAEHAVPEGEGCPRCHPALLLRGGFSAPKVSSDHSATATQVDTAAAAAMS